MIEISNEIMMGSRRARHGDLRLSRRQDQMMVRIAALPKAPWSHAFESDAEVEAAYRFVRNERVEPKAVLEPHVEGALDFPVEGATLNIIDRTKIRHKKAEKSDDTYHLGLGHQGYLAQVGILAQEKGSEPIGVSHLHVVERGEQKAKKESLLWLDGAREVQEKVDSDREFIHVVDSEGDVYELLAGLTEMGGDFVVRAGQERRVRKSADAEIHNYVRIVDDMEVIARTKVTVNRRRKGNLPGSRRNQKSRSYRVATVELRAASLRMLEPKNRDTPGYPRKIKLQLVVAREVGAPKGAEPLEWRLWTTLPAETPEQVLRITGIYSSRWLIEEYFQALKTGCNFEKREFRSKKTSERALAMYLPIASMLLRLRTLAEEEPDRPATDVLSEPVIDAIRVLDSTFRRKRKRTVRQAFQAVARIGGYNRYRKTRPGWRLLGRGLEMVLIFADGMQAGRCRKARKKARRRGYDLW